MANLFSRLFGSDTENADTPQQNIDPIQQQINTIFNNAQQWERTGQWESAKEQYKAGMELARMHGKSRAEQFFLSGLGKTYAQLDDYEQADDAFRQALNLAKHLEDFDLIARSLNNVGELFALRGEWDTAQQYHEQALERARLVNSPELLVTTLENLARDYREQSNASYAMHLLKEALETGRKSPSSMGLAASTLGKMGETALETQDRGMAEKYLKDALRYSLQGQRHDLVVRWQMALGKIALNDEKFQQAIRFYADAQRVAHETGYQSFKVFLEIASKLSYIYIQTGNYQQALAEAELAHMHASQRGTEADEALSQGLMGLSHQGLGELDKARNKLQEALSQFEAGVIEDDDFQSQLFLALGRTQNKLGDADAALGTFEEALRLAGDNAKRKAESLQLIGMSLSNTNQRKEAITKWKEAYRLFEKSGNQTGAARVLCDIANARRFLGDFKTALNDIENASLLLSEVDDRVTRGLVLSNAANLYTEVGDTNTAQSFYKDSIDIAQALKDPMAESVRRGNLGWFYVLTGKYDNALEELETAINMSRSLNDNSLIALQTNNLGWLYYRKDELATAENLLRQALTLVNAESNQRFKVLIQANMGSVLMAKGEMEEAEDLLKEAYQAALDDGIAEYIVDVQNRFVKLYILTDRMEPATQFAAAAETTSRKMGYKRGQAEASQNLGEISEKQGEQDKANEWLSAAQHLYHQISDPRASQISVTA